MDQTSGTTPTDGLTQSPDGGAPGDQSATGEQAEIVQAGFGSRGRARRRMRFLRKARELAYRDLGGLVFNLHRFGQRNDALVLAKLTTLGHIDAELRTIEAALQERAPVTVLREAGITACPRCAAIHSSEDRFCPNCGLPMSRNVDLPVAGAAAASVPSPVSAQPQAAPGLGTASHQAAAYPLASPPAPAPGFDGSGAAPAPAPTPAVATPAPVPAHRPGPPGPGRSPSPPSSMPESTPVPASPPPSSTQRPASGPGPRPSGGEESTEIIRPGARGR